MLSRRTVVTFLVGVAMGVLLVVLARPFLGARLPEAMSGRRESVTGPVAAKQRQQDRLLLTIVTPGGAILGTFTKRVAEIDLLVQTEDTLTLAIAGYQPFLQDPQITRVAKPHGYSLPVDSMPPEPSQDTLRQEGSQQEDDTLKGDDSVAVRQGSRWYD
ncbi:MAG: hypothetical protein AMS25_02070 [Gemmatimonas sp. SM23_52]|nr:MAG: hypothetical protein AMS25_02070 [Gemmatimonas sp. SM23_52]